LALIIAFCLLVLGFFLFNRQLSAILQFYHLTSLYRGDYVYDSLLPFLQGVANVGKSAFINALLGKLM
jgi:ribosome biogenesis GTPase A